MPFDFNERWTLSSVETKVSTDSPVQTRASIADSVTKILIEQPDLLPSFEDANALFESLVNKPLTTDGRTQWNAFCFANETLHAQRGNIYEFLNQEYITHLADYLRIRATELGLDRPVRILEIGAGNWALSHFLHKELDGAGDDLAFEVVATDSTTWQIPTLAEVHKMDHIEALETYSPDIVLASWMAPASIDGKDTGTFRGKDMWFYIESSKSVQEYLLIWPMHSCGMVGATWNPHIRPTRDAELLELLMPSDTLTEEQVLKYIPEYAWKMGKFEMEEVKELRKFQIWAQHDIARGYTEMDDPIDCKGHRSRTVRFTRIQK